MPTLRIDEHKVIERVASRLFTARVQELLFELLQNSQRAGAQNVHVSFPTPTCCVYEDDGHGLQDMDDLRRLFVLAESHFQDPHVEENQEPMGAGFFALLVNKRITHLSIESKTMRVAIETQRWVHDRSYWAAWEDLVVVLDRETTSGFHLEIGAEAGLLMQMRACLTQGNSVYDLCDESLFRERYNPVAGYTEILNVFLDGTRIPFALPWDVTLPRADITTEYLGNPLRIALFPSQTPGYSGLMTNYFGQLIPDYAHWKGLRVYLIVREGHPVTPLAPTRASLIQDEALRKLRTFIEEQIFSFVCRQENPAASFVKRLYQLNPERAERECPFSVVQEWKPLSSSYVFTSHLAYTSARVNDRSLETDERGPETVILKRDLASYLFIEENVICVLPKSHPAQPYPVRKEVNDAPELGNDLEPVECAIGLTSLLAATGVTAYVPVEGIPEDLIHRFWWWPGAMTDKYHTKELGTWAIQRATSNEIPSVEAWSPLQQEAFVVKETDSSTISCTSWIIGLHSTEAMVAFLTRCAHAAFEPDEDDEESSEESYGDSVHELICHYRPDTLNRYMQLIELPVEAQPLLPPSYDARQASFTLLPIRGVPHTVRLTFPDGYTKDLNLY